MLTLLTTFCIVHIAILPRFMHANVISAKIEKISYLTTIVGKLARWRLKYTKYYTKMSSYPKKDYTVSPQMTVLHLPKSSTSLS